MINKLPRIYYTLRFLTYKQIFYLIIDRVFVFKWFYFLKYQYSFIDYHKILITPNLHLTRKNNVKFKFYFKFLNKDIKFNDGIDWNFNKFGKLWNYNLQYLDYILDENVDLDYRRYLIYDISHLILNRKLKLEPYPVSIRIKNIILFDCIYDINDNVVIAALKLQIKYLTNNLEYHLLANHLLENYFTLFISSYSFNNYKLNSRISELLVYELDEQILEDGAHYERSPMYHSYILQRLNLCIDVIDNNDTIFDNRELRIFLANKARIMLGWLDLISFTNGKWPLINDSTENTSLSKTELESNFSKVNIYKQSTNLKSSGFRKFQSGLGQIIINIGEISPKYQPGHSHSDILSFYFSDGINQLIVDTGVSTYENNVVRYMERSTSSHNTVTINNFNQSDVWGSFRVGKRAKLIIHSENLNHIIAEVNNLLYSNNANHVRELILDDDSLVVKDRVFCKDDNLISTLHFNWTLNPQIKNDIIYFDCFKVEFLEGLKEIKIVNYSQAIEFNLTKNASKMVALVNKFSVFKISRNI